MKSLYTQRLIGGIAKSMIALVGTRRTLQPKAKVEYAAKKAAPDSSTAPTVTPASAQTRPEQKPATVTTLTLSGTVIRNGSRFALRETEGVLYTLDSTGRAWPFEGEDVRVTGQLDSSTSLLHVEDIRSVAF